MNRNIIVKIQDLNHFFFHKHLVNQVLFQINLEIESGEFVILRGPSGSGKSTLLSLIAGLRSVQEGSLNVIGHELKNMNQEGQQQLRRKIGYIFQSNNLLSCLTAQQNVQMSLQISNVKYSKRTSLERSKEILEIVGLGHRINYFPESLSGGEQQRVAIASALVNNPPLVLADEPTAALDIKTATNIIHLMRDLAQTQRSSVVMITHDNRFLRFADRIINIEDGYLKGTG